MNNISIVLITGQVFHKEYVDIDWIDDRLYIIESNSEYSVIPLRSILYYDVEKLGVDA